MRLTKLTCFPTTICLFILTTAGSIGHAAAAKTVLDKDRLQPFLKRYCVDCHGATKSKGDVRLDTLPMTIGSNDEAELWHDVLDALNASDMPPEDETQPTKAELISAIETISDGLHEAALRLSGSQTPVVRQLNRREYKHTLEALLGVSVDVTSLPLDPVYEGFDRVGNAQEMSPHMFTAYRDIAHRALSKVFDQPRADAPAKTIVLEPEKGRNKSVDKVLGIYTKQVHEVAAAEEKLRYDKRVRLIAEKYLSSELYGTIPGTKTAMAIGIGEIPVPTDLQCALPDSRLGRYRVTAKVALTAPSTVGETVLLLDQVGKDGSGMLRQPVAQPTITSVYPAFQTITFEFERRSDFVTNLEFRRPGTSTKNNARKQRIKQAGPPSAGHENIEVAFQQQHQALCQTLSAGKPVTLPIYPLEDIPTWLNTFVIVDHVTVEGPLVDESPSSTFSFFDNPPSPGDTVAESAYAHEIIRTFSKQAFRGRSPDAGFIQSIHEVYLSHRANGLLLDPTLAKTANMTGKDRRRARRKSGPRMSDQVDPGFASALRAALSVVLASPSFIYHVETATDHGGLTQQELAARLSYFLWSAPPDQDLLNLAASGRLRDRDVLRAQVERLLRDRRSQIAIDAFTEQWLELHRLPLIAVHKNYRKFDENLRHSFREETVRFVRHLFTDNLSGRNIIDSDFTIADRRLATFYGLTVNDDNFQRVALPAGSRRGGLLGQGAILTQTSMGDRTAPVLRGTFVLERILGTPPLPPPPNVPQLEFTGGPMTVRQRLAKHNETAQCASCHQRIDPIGLALENFDTIGDWREDSRPEIAIMLSSSGQKLSRKATFPVDASVELRGHKVDGVTGLKQYLSTQERVVMKHLIRSMSTYAMGRPMGFADELWMDELETAWRQQDYGMRELIHLIVSSDRFTK